jgi:hypothetical protein
MMTTPEPIVLKCACCDLPFATIQRGVLVILSRHHGDRHTNVISAAELLALLAPVPLDEPGTLQV